MTIKKLENNSTQSIITEEVKVLKDLLDEATHQMVGDEVFAKFKTLLNCRQVMNTSNLKN